MLFKMGFSCDTIATALGTHQSTVHKWLIKKSPRIEKANARQVRALQIKDLFAKARDKNYVPIYGLKRRILALRRMGWTMQEVQSRMTVPCNLKKIFNDNTKVTADIHRDVARIYEELCMKAGPSVQTATRSAREGVMPPLAWHDIDNPYERPNNFSRDVLI